MRLGSWQCLVQLGICAAVAASAQPGKESPLGLILSVNKAGLLRAGFRLALHARPGDILFAGDSLEAEEGSVSFLSCSDHTRQELPRGAKVTFESGKLRVQGGSLENSQPAAGCFLPAMDRLIASGRQDGDLQAAGIDPAATGAFREHLQLLPEDQRQAVLNQLGPIDQSLAASPTDPVLHLAKASVLKQHALPVDAAAEMRMVAEEWPSAAWAKSLLYDLEAGGTRGVRAAPQQPESGKNVYALLIGISQFGSDQVRPLEYAHADAIEMARLLKSPRAGGLPPENVVLMTNQQATTAAIRSAIESHLKGHGSNDTVLLFIASHGTAIQIDKRNRGFIVTYDTDPQDLATTAISMDDIRQLFEEELGGVRRLILYVDVCRAGKIGQIVPDYRATNNVTQRMAADENFFGMLAAQQGQAAVEGLNYGQGHGAFTYFLLRALNGDADLNHDGTVTMNELVDYVHDKVSESTGSRQIPKPIGDIDERRVMAYTALDGIALADYTGPILLASRSDRGLGSAQITEEIPSTDESAPTQLSSNRLKYGDAAAVLADFEKAIREGRILPAEDNSAFKFLRALKSQLPDRDYQQAADKLKVALEDRGQALIVQYLAGEQRPLGPLDFLFGAQYFEAAQLLAPDSVFLEGRKVFCEGRVKVFGKDYTGGAETLDRAIRLDPDHGYSYNALGIALLEQADYDRAILAFRDASSRAPFWAYPLHNMALALFEKGDYDSAVRTYQVAMRLAPNFAYLPYNLGLAYQRINRRKDAESMYKKALSISDDALTHNALGYLKFLEGNDAAAEAEYRLALAKSPDLVEASHDYAILLNRVPSRREQAFARWRAILRDHPDYTPSRLALAKGLAATGTHATEAASEFRLLVDKNQDYSAARIALADLEVKLENPAGALTQLREVVKREPENSGVFEKIGDLESAAGNRAGASEAYQKAMQYSQDNAAKRRLRKKQNR